MHDDSTHQDPATVKKDEGARYAIPKRDLRKNRGPACAAIYNQRNWEWRKPLREQDLLGAVKAALDTAAPIARVRVATEARKSGNRHNQSPKSSTSMEQEGPAKFEIHILVDTTWWGHDFHAERAEASHGRRIEGRGRRRCCVDVHRAAGSYCGYLIDLNPPSH
jgi:hypothetical protein